MAIEPIDDELLKSWLAAWSKGDQKAFDHIICEYYEKKLLPMARRWVSFENAKHRPDPDELVSEVYQDLRKYKGLKPLAPEMFWRMIGQRMKFKLIDQARKRGRGKRGGGQETLRLQMLFKLLEKEES